jgi:hypothetical protein
MSLKTSSAKLGRAAEGFRHTWQQARTDWQDSQAMAFEKKVVALLESCVKRALAGMDHMDGVLTKARRDCG